MDILKSFIDIIEHFQTTKRSRITNKNEDDDDEEDAVVSTHKASKTSVSYASVLSPFLQNLLPVLFIT